MYNLALINNQKKVYDNISNTQQIKEQWPKLIVVILINNKEEGKVGFNVEKIQKGENNQRREKQSQVVMSRLGYSNKNDDVTYKRSASSSATKKQIFLNVNVDVDDGNNRGQNNF